MTINLDANTGTGIDSPMKKARHEWMEERRATAQHFNVAPWTNLAETMDAFQSGWDAAIKAVRDQDRCSSCGLPKDWCACNPNLGKLLDAKD